MMRPGTTSFVAMLFAASAPLTDSASAQRGQPDFSGLWSDPPPTLEYMICFDFCTDWGAAYLESLIDDPANDEKSFLELWDHLSVQQLDGYFRPRLSPAALETFPIDPADDPGFRECQPWGFARQIFAPHQLEITQFADRIEMRYAEWDARRTIYMSGHEPERESSPSLMGVSIGHLEGDALVIETNGVSADMTMWWSDHSEELLTIERYRVSDDRERLLLDVTMTDPWGLREPLELKKVWSWAPDEDIYPYENCERPNEFIRGTGQP